MWRFEVKLIGTGSRAGQWLHVFTSHEASKARAVRDFAVNFSTAHDSREWRAVKA